MTDCAAPDNCSIKSLFQVLPVDEVFATIMLLDLASVGAPYPSNVTTYSGFTTIILPAKVRDDPQVMTHITGLVDVANGKRHPCFDGYDFPATGHNNAMISPLSDTDVVLIVRGGIATAVPPEWHGDKAASMLINVVLRSFDVGQMAAKQQFAPLAPILNGPGASGEKADAAIIHKGRVTDPLKWKDHEPAIISVCGDRDLASDSIYAVCAITGYDKDVRNIRVYYHNSLRNLTPADTAAALRMFNIEDCTFTRMEMHRLLIQKTQAKNQTATIPGYNCIYVLNFTPVPNPACLFLLLKRESPDRLFVMRDMNVGKLNSYVHLADKYKLSNTLYSYFLKPTDANRYAIMRSDIIGRALLLEGTLIGGFYPPNVTPARTARTKLWRNTWHKTFGEFTVKQRLGSSHSSHDEEAVQK
jgi:hypothetical protein